MNYANVKIEKELKEKIEREFMAGRGKGVTFSQAIEQLFGFYESAKTAERKQEGEGRAVYGATKADRLRLFIDAIKRHNANVKSGSDTDVPVHIGSAYFLGKETGLNTHRDVKPMWDAIEKELQAHNLKYNVRSGFSKHPLMKAKDSKGRSQYVGEVLKKQGLGELFGRE